MSQHHNSTRADRIAKKKFKDECAANDLPCWLSGCTIDYTAAWNHFDNPAASNATTSSPPPPTPSSTTTLRTGDPPAPNATKHAATAWPSAASASPHANGTPPNRTDERSVGHRINREQKILTARMGLRLRRCDRAVILHLAPELLHGVTRRP